MTYPSLLSTLAIALVIWVVPLRAQDAPPQEIPKEFSERLARYVDIHHAVAQLIGSEATVHDRTFAMALRQARKHARRGDIFTAEIAAPIQARLAAAVRASGFTVSQQGQPRALPSGEDDEDNADRLEVNDLFPGASAGPVLHTPIPARLLWNLPPLPRELEYRFFGASLVLVDTRANLVVDVIENALPVAVESPATPGARTPCAVHPELPACWT